MLTYQDQSKVIFFTVLIKKGLVGVQIYVGRHSLLFLASFVVVFFTSLITRLAIVSNRVTDDLIFYIDAPEGSQFSRLGYDKSFIFSFLRSLDNDNEKVFVLLSIMSFFFSLAFALYVEKKNAIRCIVLSVFVGSFVYFAQIDTHLVRQQLALYVGLIVIVSWSRFSFLKVVLIPLSLIFHELILGLYISWLGNKFKKIVHWLVKYSPFVLLFWAVLTYLGNSGPYVIMLVVLCFINIVVEIKTSKKTETTSYVLRGFLLLSVCLALMFSNHAAGLERFTVLAVVVFLWQVSIGTSIIVSGIVRIGENAHLIFTALISSIYSLRYFGYV